MTMLMITIDGEIAGYAADDARGRDAADRFIRYHMIEAATVVVVDRIPQGARRIDR